MTKRALVVGVDQYVRDFPALSGCASDAEAIQDLMQSHEDGDPNFECRLMGSGEQSQVGRDDLTSAIDVLLKDDADMALLFFAGHGMAKSDALNLVVSEGTEVSPGVSFSMILEMVNNSPVDEVVILLDCCFSGLAGGMPAIAKDVAVLRKGVSIMTASRGAESAVEQSGRGQFSVSLESGLKGGAADVLGQVSVAGLYSYVSESFGAWDQRPTFMSNVERVQTIRQCKPLVERAILRELPDWFDTPTSPHALDPSYEQTFPVPLDATDLDRYAKNRMMFKKMQKCVSNRLIEPVDEEFMYFAAINSKSCKLTNLGAHYWELAKNRRL